MTSSPGTILNAAAIQSSVRDDRCYADPDEAREILSWWRQARDKVEGDDMLTLAANTVIAILCHRIIDGKSEG